MKGEELYNVKKHILRDFLPKMLIKEEIFDYIKDVEKFNG